MLAKKEKRKNRHNNKKSSTDKHFHQETASHYPQDENKQQAKGKKHTKRKSISIKPNNKEKEKEKNPDLLESSNIPGSPRLDYRSFHNSATLFSTKKSSGGSGINLPPTAEERRSGFIRGAGRSFDRLFGKKPDSPRSTPDSERKKPAVKTFEDTRIPSTVFEENDESTIGIQTTQGALTSYRGSFSESDEMSQLSDRYSLALEVLIDDEKDPKLYKETVGLNAAKEESDNALKKILRYPWYTPEALQSLYEAKMEQVVKEKQVDRIKLIQKLCTILDVAYKKYLKVTQQQDDAQLDALSKHLRAWVKFVIRNDLTEVYPTVTERLSSSDKSSFMPQIMVFDTEAPDSVYRNELKVRATIQVQSWKFHKAKRFKGPLSDLLTFLKSNIELPAYDITLNELFKLIVDTGMTLREIENNTTELLAFLEIDNGRGNAPKGFVALSTQLHLEDGVKDAVMTKLAQLLKEEGNRNLPTCMGDESEFYIPATSLLLINLQKNITDFMREHAKLFKGDGSVSPRNISHISEKLARIIKNDFVPLMAQEVISPNRSFGL